MSKLPEIMMLMGKPGTECRIRLFRFGYYDFPDHAQTPFQPIYTQLTPRLCQLQLRAAQGWP